MNAILRLTALFLALLSGAIASSQDGETKLAYFQTAAFNAPVLPGWEDQSREQVAQFHLAAAAATIRSALADADDPIAAAEADLASWLGVEVGQPVYQNKVNLADGTWSVLIYDIDAGSTASVMTRRAGGRFAVISFVERDPAARTIMLAVARGEAAHEDASAEIAQAAEALNAAEFSALDAGAGVELPSGEWATYAGERHLAMGMVFGNDSFIALQEGEIGDLETLADAWNRTLLGFFITPDNRIYLALGLFVVFAILGTLVFSFGWRARGIRKDLALLDELARADE